MLTLGQAARMTGKGKTTLTRAIKAGRLSATRRDDGGYLIDPSELTRVYDVTPETGAGASDAARRATPEGDSRDSELKAALADAEAKVEGLKALLIERDRLLDEVRASRDDWKAQTERLTLALAAPQPTPETRASEESAKTAQAIAAFEQLAERAEAMAAQRAIKPWWRRLVG
jgi:hypothetical protein